MARKHRSVDVMFERLFDASYDPDLTDVDKDKLKEMAKLKLEFLMNGIDRDLDADVLLEELGDYIKSQVKLVGDASFATDFAPSKESPTNCTVYADLLVLGLEHLKRSDILDNIRVKYSHSHIWLVYDGRTSLEAVKMGRKCDEDYGFDSLVAINWFSKGVYLSRLGKHEKALACYDRALELDPKEYIAWNNKGNVLNTLEKYEEAIKCYDMAIRLKPDFFGAWNNKGIILHGLGKYEEAIECYDQTIKLNPDLVDAYNNKGVALKELGRIREALLCFSIAGDICKNNLLAGYPL